MAKKKKGKAHPSQIHKSYQGDKTKNSFCPKCGVGVFMSNHKDRSHCGKCGYTEFRKS